MNVVLTQHSSSFRKCVSDHINVIEKLVLIENQAIQVAIECCEAINRGGKIMFCGNGGSAADCQHLAAEFTGRFVSDRDPLPAIALTTDSSALTCISNDFSFNQVFARQVKAIGKPSDVLIGISTSGSSENVFEAIKIGRQLGIRTVGLIGKEGGKIRDLADISIVVPSQVTARIQEAHILIGHFICQIVEDACSK